MDSNKNVTALSVVFCKGLMIPQDIVRVGHERGELEAYLVVFGEFSDLGTERLEFVGTKASTS